MVDDSSYALQAHEQDCFSIAMAAERWLASGGEDDVAYLWDHQVSGQSIFHGRPLFLHKNLRKYVFAEALR